MQLDPIDLRLDLGVREEPLELLGGEVRDADMARQALCVDGFHRAPRVLKRRLRRRREVCARAGKDRARFERDGPMHHVHVEVVETEIRQGLLDRRPHVLLAVRVAPRPTSASLP